MLDIYYVGFNGYQQCPNDGRTILPKVIHRWEKFSVKDAKDVECTFRNVVVKTRDNFIIYGVATKGDSTKPKQMNFPVYPKAFLATDDYLYVSENNNLWRTQFDGEWLAINFTYGSDEELLNWSNKEIIKLCYIHNKPQVIILLNDGSIWRLDDGMKLSTVFTPTLDKATDISSGFEHALILTESGCVMTFGSSSHGQLGHGDLEVLKEPMQVLALGGLKVVKIAAAGWHSSAVTDSGDLYMWGWNNFGQLTVYKEDTSSTDSDECDMATVPVLIDVEDNKEINIRNVACGVRHSVVITENNEMYATGWNEYGQLCVDVAVSKQVNKFMKVPLPGGSRKKEIRCGPWSTLIFEENEDSSVEEKNSENKNLTN